MKSSCHIGDRVPIGVVSVKIEDKDQQEIITEINSDCTHRNDNTINLMMYTKYILVEFVQSTGKNIVQFR